MPNRSFRICANIGCNELTIEKYCPNCKEKHEKQEQRYWDKQRGTSRQRGYTNYWQKYSKKFLNNPKHQFCQYKLPGCEIIANCVDHQQPPESPSDPLFWEPSNHIPSCRHCNSVKGHRYLDIDDN